LVGCQSKTLTDRNPYASSKERPVHWIMYFDGALNLEGAGAGVLLISPQGNNSSTSCRYTTRPLTMEQNTKL
jgi:hypothetical protein